MRGKKSDAATFRQIRATAKSVGVADDVARRLTEKGPMRISRQQVLTAAVVLGLELLDKEPLRMLPSAPAAAVPAG